MMKDAGIGLLATVFLTGAIATSGQALATPSIALQPIPLVATAGEGFVSQVHYKGWRHHRISERRAARIARHSGFHSIKSVKAKRDVYVVRAKARGNRKVRVIVGAYNGRVLAVLPGHRRGGGQGWY